jgi:hypothetical protein
MILFGDFTGCLAKSLEASTGSEIRLVPMLDPVKGCDGKNQDRGSWTAQTAVHCIGCMRRFTGCESR